MSKMIKAVKVVNIAMAGVTVVEGVCASIVVDKALQAVPGNRFVNLIGRSVVSSMISVATCYAAQGFLELNKMLDDSKDDHDKYHKVTIVDDNENKIKNRYKPGELIHISARDLHSSNNEFAYWYCTKGNVKFDDSLSEATTFIMPDENVRIEFAIIGRHIHDDSNKTTEPESDPIAVEFPEIPSKDKISSVKSDHKTSDNEGVAEQDSLIKGL